MPKPKKSAKDLNTQERIGRAKIQNAIGGRDQFGRKLSKEDRRKLMHSGGEDIVAGRRAAQTTDSNN